MDRMNGSPSWNQGWLRSSTIEPEGRLWKSFKISLRKTLSNSLQSTRDSMSIVLIVVLLNRSENLDEWEELRGHSIILHSWSRYQENLTLFLEEAQGRSRLTRRRRMDLFDSRFPEFRLRTSRNQQASRPEILYWGRWRARCFEHRGRYESLRFDEYTWLPTSAVTWAIVPRAHWTTWPHSDSFSKTFVVRESKAPS